MKLRQIHYVEFKIKSIYINQEIKQLVQMKDKSVHELNHQKKNIHKIHHNLDLGNSSFSSL
jgi:hypothetical protein